MSQFQLDGAMLRELAKRVPVGGSIKIKHNKRLDGTNCSVGKSPAMSVTRSTTGWRYYCHRCTLSGYVNELTNGPEATADKIKALRAEKDTTPYNAVERISIPPDSVCILTEGNVPWDAKKWLYDAMLTEDMMKRYKISWSSGYNRVIIPCYQQGNGSLIGWVGREVLCKTKEERTANGISKYITQKKKGISRPKSKSTISAKAYANMKAGFPKKKK